MRDVIAIMAPYRIRDILTPSSALLGDLAPRFCPTTTAVPVAIPKPGINATISILAAIPKAEMASVP